MVLKTYSYEDLQAILKILEVNFVIIVLLMLHNQRDVWKN